MYIKKFIIGAFLLASILIYLHKHIKMRRWESYLNILNSFLLAYPLYLLIAKYLIAKAERQERAHVLFAYQLEIYRDHNAFCGLQIMATPIRKPI